MVKAIYKKNITSMCLTTDGLENHGSVCKGFFKPWETGDFQAQCECQCHTYDDMLENLGIDFKDDFSIADMVDKPCILERSRY